MSSKGSAGTVSPNRTSAVTPTHAQPLSVGNLNAFHAAESGDSPPGPRAPRSETSTSSAYTWQDWGSLAATLPSIPALPARDPVSQARASGPPVEVSAPAPVSAEPAPTPALAPVPSARSYVADLAEYDADVKYWYVVVVGRSVGVFSNP